MREQTPPSGENADDDPWGFVTDRVAKHRGRAAEDSADSDADTTEQPPRPTGSRLSDAGEFTGMQLLRRRALPLGIAIAAVFVLGFITEVVAASRFVSQLGATALIIIYPLGSVMLIAVALMQITWIDRIPRNKAFTRVTFGYAGAFIIALILIAIPATTVIGTGMVWLVADQLNFLLPLIVWALVGDLFNAGEGRKIYPWVTSWQYGGQLLGLAIATAAPLLFIPLGIPLPWLLVIGPIGIIALGIWLPRALRGRPVSRGHGRDEGLVTSFSSAWDFVRGVKVFRAMFATSVLVFVAGMTLEATFISSADRFLNDAAALQVLYGGTLVVVFAIAGLLQWKFTTRIVERLDIPGSLLVLPIFAVIASALLILGLAIGVLPILVVGIILWWVPRWSIDEVARRASLAVVPDEKRARVSFLVDLVPFALGLLVAGGVTAIATALDQPILAPIIALPIAALAIIPARIMMRGWRDALLDPRLRRRKRLS
jgi:hypothetical protein